MNILLIYPEFPDTFWSFKHALKMIHKRAALPPLGLLTVAAMLPKEWNRRVVDLNVRRLTDKLLDWADYVFIGAMSVQRESVKETIARCKQHNRIISLMHDHLLLNSSTKVTWVAPRERASKPKAPDPLKRSNTRASGIIV